MWRDHSYHCSLSAELKVHLGRGRGTAATSQPTTAQSSAANTEVGNLDALTVVNLLDEVALALAAVVVLVGEPDIGDGISLDRLDVVGDGGIAAGKAVEHLLIDFGAARKRYTIRETACRGLLLMVMTRTSSRRKTSWWRRQGPCRRGRRRREGW